MPMEVGAEGGQSGYGVGLGVGGLGGVGVIELLAEYRVAAANADDCHPAVCCVDDGGVEAPGFHPAQVGDGAL